MELEEPGGSHSQNSVTTSTLYLRPLLQATDYRIRVRGRNRASQGPWSQWFTFTTVVARLPKPGEATIMQVADQDPFVEGQVPTNIGTVPGLVYQVQASTDINLAGGTVTRAEMGQPVTFSVRQGVTNYVRTRWFLEGETNDEDVTGPWSDVQGYAAPADQPLPPADVTVSYLAPRTLVVAAESELVERASLLEVGNEWYFLLLSDELALTNFSSIPALGIDDMPTVEVRQLPVSGDLIQWFIPEDQDELVAVEARILASGATLGETVTVTVYREDQGGRRRITSVSEPLPRDATVQTVVFLPDAPIRVSSGVRHAIGLSASTTNVFALGDAGAAGTFNVQPVWLDL